MRAQSSNTAPLFDHHLPGELNQRALYELKDNNISTAVILLERAYRLNPYSPDIKANLEAVQKIAKETAPIQINGEFTDLDALTKAESTGETTEQVVNVPAMWPIPKP
jgi:hypothetical protein